MTTTDSLYAVSGDTNITGINQSQLTTKQLKQSIETTETSDNYKYLNFSSAVINVDISWGSMDFTYVQDEWNPENHVYDIDEWRTTSTDSSAGTITVENKSNISLDVNYSFIPNAAGTAAGIGMEFKDLSENNLLFPFELKNGTEAKVTKLKLINKPTNYINQGTTLGTVTLSMGVS